MLRYRRARLQQCRLFGYLLRICVVIIGFFAVTDLLGQSHWGYPVWTMPVLAAAYVAGHFITKLAGNALARD